MAEALLLVDIQNDFLPGGALAVPHGNEVVAPVVSLMDKFELVYATQDWHPSDHASFAANHPGSEVGEVVKLGQTDQILWPVHCVQDSRGADFADALERDRFAHVSRKGVHREVDSYSGFFDNERRHETDLHQRLQADGVEKLFVCGLATEYCVRFTVLDALSLGYQTALVTDACRGLDEAEIAAAITQMQAGGAELIQSGQVAGTRV